MGVCSRTLSLIEIDKGATYTLHDFMVLQERKSVDVKEKLATLREEVVSVVVRACQVSVIEKLANAFLTWWGNLGMGQ